MKAAVSGEQPDAGASNSASMTGETSMAKASESVQPCSVVTVRVAVYTTGFADGL